jgi:ion channel-forming bestrophin family protein
MYQQKKTSMLSPELTAFSTIAKRLAPWFVGIAVYGLAVALIVREYQVRFAELGAEASFANTIILGMLLAFRNRNAFDRWWEARCLWGQLINETRNLAWKIRGALPDDLIRREGLSAILIGFAEALKRHLRGGVTLQEIPGFEKNTANPAHVPSYLAGQILKGISTWQRDGHIDGMTALRLDPHARALLDVCGACERIRNTPISRSYVFLLRFGIILNILVAPWFSIPIIGLWGIPVMEMIGFFLLGVESVDSEVEEPFGTGADDLRLERYCETIRESVEAILDGD